MWRASRPVPSAIWWRQLVPQATSSVSGAAARILGSTPSSPILHRHIVMLGLEAERAGHAAAGRIEGLDLESGDQAQARSAAAPAVAKAFWWQWPCSSAVCPGIARERRG